MNYQNHTLSQKKKKIYNIFSKHFLITPKLLHNILDYIYNFRYIKKTIQQTLTRYTKQTRKKIIHFKKYKNNKQYTQFLLHTTILLKHIPNKKKYIFTKKQTTKILITINIFKTKYYIITKNKLNSNIKLSKLNLKKKNNFVKIRHLQPYLTNT